MGRPYLTNYQKGKHCSSRDKINKILFYTNWIKNTDNIKFLLNTIL